MTIRTRTIRTHFLVILCLFWGSTPLQYAQVLPRTALKSSTDPRVMDEFMSLRFGMFIHWGPVTLRGTEIGWSRGHDVPTSDYDQLYKEFNPVLFNAEEWVRTAKNAGMKYIVITSKHHDGFCLWDSRYTTYDIAATPFKRDILGELARATKKYGIKLGIYFSILDWHDPNYPIHNDGKPPDPNADMAQYIQTIKNQLREILQRYDPYMLWFDGQWESPWTDEMGIDLYTFLKGIKRDLIINNRLGKEMTAIHDKEVDFTKMIGDFDTPEQKVGKLTLDFPWESCITICTQWAWKPNDKMKSVQESLHTLIKTASGNGNLLFNVGPMPDGRIEQRQIVMLQEVGDWLRKFGESIYGTNGGPYTPNQMYSATRKGNKVYIHIFDTSRQELMLPVLEGVRIVQATMWNGNNVSWNEHEGKWHFTFVSNAANSISNVLVLQVDKPTREIPVVPFTEK